MLLYTDRISGDEMFSDAFPMCALLFCLLSFFLLMSRSRQSKIIDDIVFEVDCQNIIIKEGGADVNIGLFFSSYSVYLIRSLFVFKVPIPPPRSKRKHWKKALSKSTMSCIRFAYRQLLLTRAPFSNTSRFLYPSIWSGHLVILSMIGIHEKHQRKASRGPRC
jgi:translationally controlled tumor-related protein